MIAGHQRLLITPDADTAPLELIVQSASKGEVVVTVADESGVELDALASDRGPLLDQALRPPAAAQEGLGEGT